MKIRVNKGKLRAAISKRLTEKKTQYQKQLSDWEADKKKRVAILIKSLTEKIAQLRAGTLDPDQPEQPFWQKTMWNPYSDYYGLSSGGGYRISSKPLEPNYREESRLLAQLDMMDETAIEIDDHSDYFNYI